MLLATLLMAKVSTRCDSWELGVLKHEERVCVCRRPCVCSWLFLIIFLPVTLIGAFPY